jgi:VanZ family protein
MHRKTRKWLAVWLFSLVIFLTLPFGPAIRDFLYETFGKWFVIYFVGISLLAGLVAVFVAVLRRERRFDPVRLLWLLLIVSLYWRFLKRTFPVPIESVHFIEYGILSVLIYRAMRESFSETWIFVVAFLFTYTVGMVDEVIQWALPNRVGAMRDVWFNAVSGGLAQIFLWKVVVPPGLTKGLPAKSFRLAAWCAAFNTAFTGIFLVHVSGFGYRTADPEVGVFFSRMKPEEIRETDSTRGSEYAVSLDTTYERSYEEFLEATSDLFLYEMRVHLFRRDRHFATGSYDVACCEQKFLEKYFGNTLAFSRYGWRDGQDQVCGERAPDCARYRSPVSQEIIVRYGQRELWAGAGILTGCFIFLATRKRLYSVG